MNPPGDPARHLALAELEARRRALPAPPREHGRVALLVRRRSEQPRETLERVRLSPEHGMPGDRWGGPPAGKPEEQLTVIRSDVAELIANGQAITLFGDNVYVDLDLSDANLPAGSRLQLGAALIEVSPKPHNGCAKFRARFGADALRFVQDKALRDQNLRGVYWRVLEAGEVAAGDAVRVLSRP